VPSFKPSQLLSLLRCFIAPIGFSDRLLVAERENKKAQLFAVPLSSLYNVKTNPRLATLELFPKTLD